MQMCAIAGLLGVQAEQTTLDSMLKTMARRGPDGSGVFQSQDCTLLHTRLAIIDPDGGRQPMVLQLPRRQYTIVYNGELYNTEEIRRELCGLGHVFCTHSDTEVVLHAYAEWGADALERFNGIFAFAVWESHSRRLFLARDRIGVKPLFYMPHGEGLLFASEIKTILAHPDVRAELTAEGAAEILLLGPGRTPGSGVFKNVLELEPGCFDVWEDGKLRTTRYWMLRDRPHTDDFAQTVQTVRELVIDAIRRQTVSDVPLGTFLSGGLDSSLISSVCAADFAGKGKTLNTFSVDYVDNDKYFTPGKFQPNSDTDYIRQMERYLGSRHHWTVLSPQTLMENLEDATIARDLPGMADVDFSLLAFCGEIRQHVKVALSGECADEIFGGYPWYRDPEIRDADGFPWAQTTAQRAEFLSEDLRRRIDPEEFVHERYLQTLRQCDLMPENSPLERRMKQMVNLNFRWFMQTLLDRKDRMSMYHGLEVRVPFCDYRIAEYLYTVPWSFKDYQGREKGLLRCAAEGLLPPEVLYRKKSPYPKTFHPKYLELVGGALKLLLEDPSAPIFQLVRRDRLEGLLKEDYPWPWYGQLMRTPQTIAFMLQVNFWLTYYKISVV